MKTFTITSTFAEYKSDYKNFPGGQVWNQPGESLSYEQCFSKVGSYLYNQHGFEEQGGVYTNPSTGDTFEYGDNVIDVDGEMIRIEG
jgi:hypothetical protein